MQKEFVKLVAKYFEDSLTVISFTRDPMAIIGNTWQFRSHLLVSWWLNYSLVQICTSRGCRNLPWRKLGFDPSYSSK